MLTIIRSVATTKMNSSCLLPQGLPKGTFLTCSSDDTIRAWNLHDSSVKRNIFCPELLKIIYMDSRLSYITDIDLTTQNSATGGSSEKVDANYDGKNGVRCMKISHDGSHLACGDRSGNITYVQMCYYFYTTPARLVLHFNVIARPLVVYGNQNVYQLCTMPVRTEYIVFLSSLRPQFSPYPLYAAVYIYIIIVYFIT